MLRREQQLISTSLRRTGGGIYQYGAGIYQYGAGTTPYGGGIMQYGSGVTPYGGASMKAVLAKVPLRRMGGAGITDLFKKGIKNVKKYFKKEGPGLAKAAASIASSAVSDAVSGKSLKDVGKSVGSQVGSIAREKALAVVPESYRGIAEKGLDKGVAYAKKKVGGNAPLRAAKGELTPAQLGYLKKRAERSPNDAAPVFDRHELRMMSNIIEGKQILGSGMKRAQ